MGKTGAGTTREASYAYSRVHESTILKLRERNARHYWAGKINFTCTADFSLKNCEKVTEKMQCLFYPRPYARCLCLRMMLNVPGQGIGKRTHTSLKGYVYTTLHIVEL